MLIASGPWSEQVGALDKMSLGDLVRSCCTHHSIRAALRLAMAATAAPFFLSTGSGQPILAAVVIVVVCPLAEHLIHRFVGPLTSPARHPATAPMWQRRRDDHHQRPPDLSPRRGAHCTTLPAIALIALPTGWSVAGSAGGHLRQQSKFAPTTNLGNGGFGTLAVQPENQPKNATVHDRGDTIAARRRWLWRAGLSADSDACRRHRGTARGRRCR